MSDSKKYAVIVAGGTGVRMGGTVLKQFLPLVGLPVVCHAIKAFADAVPGISIILVVPPDLAESANTIIKSYLPHFMVTIVGGGATRYESVQNGLGKITEEGIVFIHDGVRPLVSAALILRCMEQAMEQGSAIPVIPVNDSIRLIKADGLTEPVNREQLRSVQTPQTFRTEVILPAFKQAHSPAFTDEATVAEAYGATVHIIDGDRSNIKITTPGDLAIAESLLKGNV